MPRTAPPGGEAPDQANSDAQPLYRLKHDAVNHPSHYQGKNGLESIDVIEAFALNFNLGNAVKYILRAGKKTQDPTEDLRKASWYLQRAIDKQPQAYSDYPPEAPPKEPPPSWWLAFGFIAPPTRLEEVLFAYQKLGQTLRRDEAWEEACLHYARLRNQPVVEEVGSPWWRFFGLDAPPPTLADVLDKYRYQPASPVLASAFDRAQDYYAKAAR